MTAARPDAPARAARVLVVEDQPLMAELLVARLEVDDAFDVCGVTGSVPEAVRIAKRTRPDLVIMDHALTDGTGVDATKRILAVLPRTRVVMLTAEMDPSVVGAAMAAGAVGYINKHTVVERLLAALHAAMRGETVIPAKALRSVMGRAGGVLSPRERDVLLLMGEGLDSRAIAARLSVSYHTVREHAQRILGKLGVRSRLEAVARAREAGIL